jgi:hypothetical protein
MMQLTVVFCNVANAPKKDGYVGKGRKGTAKEMQNVWSKQTEYDRRKRRGEKKKERYKNIGHR